jgi:hypothetical protein
VARGKSFVGEILHAVGVRLRVTGLGNLDISLHSLDDVRNVSLQSLQLTGTTNREPTVLANFQEQRIQLKLETNEMDDVFHVSRIVIFVKPVSESYPIGV